MRPRLAPNSFSHRLQIPAPRRRLRTTTHRPKPRRLPARLPARPTARQPGRLPQAKKRQAHSPQTSNDAAQAPSQAGDGTTAVLPTGLSAITNTPPAAHADITAATTADGTANAQGASTNAKADGIGLPSFGLSAANGAAQASATTAAAQATASTAGTVPIAGLAVAIASHAQAGSHQFDIRLDPPELGRIDVQLNVDSNGQITSHITADRPDTLQLLQSQQPQIQQALDQSGCRRPITACNSRCATNPSPARTTMAATRNSRPRRNSWFPTPICRQCNPHKPTPA